MQGNKAKGLSPTADQVLLDYECKGNVRELERIIRRTIMVRGGNYIKVEDLNIQISKPTHKSEEISLNTFSLKQLRAIGDTKARKEAVIHQFV
jgi:DNA-binding NtrC family response regulator